MEKEGPAEIRSFDEMYSKYEGIYGHPYQELQDLFRSFSERGSVLDLGSGQGRDSIFLSSLGYKVTAIDASEVGIEQMLENSRSLGLDIRGIVGDVAKIKLNEQYDMILLDMVLHSFEQSDQLDIIRKWSTCLKDRGHFCIVFPGDMDVGDLLNIFEKLSDNWVLKHDIVVQDVPKHPLFEDEEEYNFEMILIQRSDKAI